MSTVPPLFLVLDLTGTFAFALNGALTAIRVAKLDVVGVVTLGMVTALGGGIIRDILIDSPSPATFSDWRYLAVAATGSLIAFGFSRRLNRVAGPILVLDAAGLSLFAVSRAIKALESRKAQSRSSVAYGKNRGVRPWIRGQPTPERRGPLGAGLVMAGARVTNSR